MHQGDDVGFRFLVDGEHEIVEWTYADLDRKARSIAVSLQSLDLEGERALLLYPSGLDFVAAFFGCLYAGVTAVPAYPPRRNRNMARIDAIANDAGGKDRPHDGRRAGTRPDDDRRHAVAATDSLAGHRSVGRRIGR